MENPGPYYDTDFAKLLRELHKSHGWGELSMLFQDLYDPPSVPLPSETTLANWGNGRNHPSEGYLQRIQWILSKSLEELGQFLRERRIARSMWINGFHACLNRGIKKQ